MGIQTFKIKLSDRGEGLLWDGKYAYYRLGKEAFETLYEAQWDAEVRRQKKIKSLEKQLEKLKNLKFKTPEEKKWKNTHKK